MRVHDVPSMRDRLCLLALDENYDLQPRIDVRALGIGLVAAVLTDLLLHDRIYVKHGLIHRNERRTGPAADPIAADILNAIAAQQAPRLADVLRGARADLLDDGHNPYQRVYERTLGGLVAAGHLLEHRRRFRSTRYQLADAHLVASIRAQFNHRLVYSHGRVAPAVDSVCALVLAMNLHSVLAMPYGTGEAEQILLDITGRIPSRFGSESPLAILPQLVQIVRYAVGDLATAPF